jgi:hypothetical protein
MHEIRNLLKLFKKGEIKNHLNMRIYKLAYVGAILKASGGVSVDIKTGHTSLGPYMKGRYVRLVIVESNLDYCSNMHMLLIYVTTLIVVLYV